MKTVCAALVLVMICSLQVASDTQSLNKAHVPSRVVDCCLTYYPHAVPLRSFVSYSIIDSSSCPLKAVVFQTCYTHSPDDHSRFKTNKGVHYCVDPSVKWVKRYVAALDHRQVTNVTMVDQTAL